MRPFARFVKPAAASAVAVCAALGVSAQAADFIPPAPEPVVTPTWAGPYLGGFIGGHWGDVDVKIGAPRANLGVDVDGFLGGVLVH